MQKHYTSEGLVLEPEVPVVQPVTIDEAVAVPIDAEPEIVHSNQPTSHKTSTKMASASSSSQPGRTSNRHTGFECLLCGDTKGMRIQPGHNFFLRLCGNADILLQNPLSPDSSSPAKQYSMWFLRLCGNVNLYVPPGTTITVRRIQLCGNKQVHVPEADPEVQFVPPNVTINILTLCGDVKVLSEAEYEDW